MKIKTDKHERITNLNMATFLYASDCQITGINQVASNQKEFCFVKTDRLEELMWTYKFAEKDDDNLLVNVHKFTYARQYLLDRINE